MDYLTRTVQNKEMFSRLKILELASVLAGPNVGQFFAELGAEVIKIENPHTGGDVTRSWRVAGEQTDDRSAYFCSCNWGKKSVVLDLSNSVDRNKFIELAKRSDIIIASYKPGDAEKLGVSYHQLREHQPRLIYGMITGYGAADDRVGYDAVIQAESGFMDMNGEEGGMPVKMPVALIDVLAAHQLKEGLLLALLKRGQSGEGSYVEVSLMETALSSLANQATNWLVAGKLPQRKGSAHPNIAPYGDTFETADGKLLMLAVGNDKQFENLIVLLKLQPTSEQRLHFSTNVERVKNRIQLNQFLSSAIRNWNGEELATGLRMNKIPGGLVRNVKEALSDPLAEPIYLDNKDMRGIRGFVARGVAVNATLSPPPHLGEHTEEVIQQLTP